MSEVTREEFEALKQEVASIKEKGQPQYSPEELRKVLQENEKDFLEMLQEFLTQSEVER